MATEKQLQLMGKKILDFEARRDRNGHLAVYDLPSGDGGGSYEVAGINDRYHPEELRVLVNLIRAHKYDEAEQYAINFFIKYSDLVKSWSSKGLDPGVEFFLRDCVFNRGPTGAARILQRALGVTVDGIVGAQTRGAVDTIMPEELLTKLRIAREWYERHYAHRNESSKFWRGLVNRWNNAIATANMVRALA